MTEFEIYSGKDWKTARISFAWVYDSLNKITVASSFDDKEPEQSLKQRLSVINRQIPTLKEQIEAATADIALYIPISPETAKAVNTLNNELDTLEKLAKENNSTPKQQLETISKLLQKTRLSIKNIDR